MNTRARNTQRGRDAAVNDDEESTRKVLDAL